MADGNLFVRVERNGETKFIGGKMFVGTVDLTKILEAKFGGGQLNCNVVVEIRLVPVEDISGSSTDTGTYAAQIGTPLSSPK